MKMLWEILVPTCRNNGKPFRTRYHKVWDKKVKEISGGLTILTPTIKGEWISKDDETFVDRTIPVRIYCSEEDMEKIASFTIKYYEQLAVMYYCISDKVIIKHA